MNEDTRAELIFTIRQCLAGDGLLFLGAGASFGCKNNSGENIPLGNQLSSYIAKDCGLDGQYELDAVSQHYIETHSEYKLVQLLRKHLKIQTVSNALIQLGAVDWMRVWTTNYEESMALAFEKNSKSYKTVSTSEDARLTRGGRKLVVHINGMLSSLNHNRLPTDFVLTSASQATTSFLNSEWSSVFRQDLNTSKVIVFIGYSLADIDISRIIFASTVYQSKIIFIDSDRPDPVLKSKISKFGGFYAIGINGFANLVQEIQQSWTPSEKEPHYSCLEEMELGTNSSKLRDATDDDVFDLFLHGEVKDELLLHQINGNPEAAYLVAREAEKEILDFVNKEKKVAVLTGGFGSGKTVSLRSIGLQLVLSGRKVFYVSHGFEILEEELSKLCNTGAEFCLIIDNYGRHIDLVKIFSRSALAKCTLILSERIETHEISENLLIENLLDWEHKCWNLDNLSVQEIDSYKAYIDRRGLWGVHASKSNERRLSFLRTECARNVQAIYLEVIRSKVVKDKMMSLVEHFKIVPNGIDILLGFCLLQSIGETPYKSLLSELLNLEQKGFEEFLKDPICKQVIGVQYDQANFRSPVIAVEILRNQPSPSLITKLISRIVVNSHRFSRYNKHVMDILWRLYRHGNLDKILPKGKGNVRASLIDMYDEIGKVDYLFNSPDYWLQYGIARISFDELDKARWCFENGEKIARGKGWTRYRNLENHMARLLVREASICTDSEEAYSKIKEAMSTLKDQASNQNKHYPFRVAKDIDSVVHKFMLTWSKDQLTAITSLYEVIVREAENIEPGTVTANKVKSYLPQIQDLLYDLIHEISVRKKSASKKN